MVRLRKIPVAILLASLVAIARAPPAGGSLPVARCRSVDDGLPSPTVQDLEIDVDGALWIATTEGLARFEGDQLVTFGRAEGLHPPLVWDVAVDEDGRVWLGSHGAGLVLLLDGAGDGIDGDGAVPLVGADGRSRFLAWPVGVRGIVGRLRPRAGGGVWFSTAGELGSIVASERAFALHRERRSAATDAALFELADAEPWTLEGEAGRFRIVRSGIACELPELDSEPVELGRDADGRWVVATSEALHRSRPGTAGACGASDWERVALELEPGERILTFARRVSGGLWVGTSRDLWRVSAGGVERVGDRFGLPADEILAVADERRAGLVVGTGAHGLCRVALEGLASFAVEPAGEAGAVQRVIEGPDGRIYALADEGWFEVRGSHLVEVPGSGRDPWRGVGSRVLAAAGGYWVGTDRGLARIEGAALDPRRATLLGEDFGLPRVPVFGGRPVSGLHLDPRGTLRVSFAGVGLYERRAGQRGFEPVPGPVEWRAAPPFAFEVAEDGRMLVGDFLGLRRSGPRGFEPVALPGGADARVFHRARDGALWIGRRYGGLVRLESGAGDAGAIRTWTAREGLASDAVWSIAEDSLGALWLCTGRGLNRLDPARGELRTWTSADGLPPGPLHDCRIDSRGRLWLAGKGGLARLDPSGFETDQPLGTRWRRIVADGHELELSWRGEPSRRGVVLGPGAATLEVRASGPPFARDLRYRWRLQPSADGRWSESARANERVLAGLGPGRYRLEVEAVAPSRAGGGKSAVLEFEVLAPIWRRGWFLGFAAVVLAGAVGAAHRLRLARERALFRVRERLAADLHDDIGAGLARIAILAEVARRDPTAATGGDRLVRIADSARELVEAMSDVVWALRPERDSAADLVQRLRRFASDLLGEQGLEIAFDGRIAPQAGLDSGVRRELLLAGKELLTNVARHARARRVEVAIEGSGGRLALTIADDGIGCAGPSGQGQGLVSLARRARRLGGAFTIGPHPLGGCGARFEIPLGRTSSPPEPVGRDRSGRAKIRGS